MTISQSALEGGPDDPALGAFIQARQGLAGQPCRAGDEPLRPRGRAGPS